MISFVFKPCSIAFQTPNFSFNVVGFSLSFSANMKAIIRSNQLDQFQEKSPDNQSFLRLPDTHNVYYVK